MEILGQVYRDTVGNITLLAIRVTTMSNDIGRGQIFLNQSALLIGIQDLDLVDRVLGPIHDQ